MDGSISKPWYTELKAFVLKMQKDGFSNEEIKKEAKSNFNRDNCYFLLELSNFLKDTSYQSLIHNKTTKHHPPHYKRLKDELRLGLLKDCKVDKDVDKDNI